MMFPIEYREPAGREILAYWEDFLTNEDLDWLLSRSEWNNTTPGLIGGSDVPLINDNVRKSNVSWIDSRDASTHFLWKKFSDVFADVNRNFFHFDLTGLYEPMQLSIYDSSYSHYDWHTDASFSDIKVPRKLSMALCLNDPSEFEGGELQVKLSNDKYINLELKVGRAWFFPSWVLHRVSPVTKGTRKSLVLWSGGPAFK